MDSNEEDFVDVVLQETQQILLTDDNARESSSFEEMLTELANKTFGGKCKEAGWIIPHSITVLQYSAPVVDGKVNIFVELQLSAKCFVPALGKVISVEHVESNNAGHEFVWRHQTNSTSYIAMKVFVLHGIVPLSVLHTKDNCVDVKVLDFRCNQDDDYIQAIGEFLTGETD